MPVREDWMAGLDLVDQERIEEALSLVRETDTDSVLASLPGLTEWQRLSIAAHCAFSHAAVLVCPDSTAELVAGLRAQGLAVDDPSPSVVVRERLSLRHGVPPSALNVAIVHIHVPAGSDGTRMVEIFSLEAPPDSGVDEIAARERLERNESHLGLNVDSPDEVAVAGLRALLVDQGGMAPDGGGYNSIEDCTVLYFRNTSADRQWTYPYRRMELRLNGRCAAALAAHQEATLDDPAKQLLELMTGAWTTQAIAVAAEFGLADCLPGPDPGASPVSVPDLAARLGADQDGLARLLRYLAALGLVAPAGDSYTLTALGEPLRHDARSSLRPLAMMYGGVFYESFGALAHAVKTGEQGFEWLLGAGHFEYFAQRPALAALFDSAMAASAPMFDPVASLVDFSDAKVVVDIAGGNGELLSRLLRHAPHLRGVLFEKQHVLSRAQQRLADLGCGDRCDYVPGDFTQSIPDGGDIYILSRILHDWDDQQCAAILRCCAESMPEGARLLVVERLLPTDGTSSLAVPWDLHMLCNVGGRERTAEHYQQLLEGAGFSLDSVTRLPLDGNLLQARRMAETEPD
jgi:hypothetical protein